MKQVMCPREPQGTLGQETLSSVPIVAAGGSCPAHAPNRPLSFLSYGTDSIPHSGVISVSPP